MYNKRIKVPDDKILKDLRNTKNLANVIKFLEINRNFVKENHILAVIKTVSQLCRKQKYICHYKDEKYLYIKLFQVLAFIIDDLSSKESDVKSFQIQNPDNNNEEGTSSLYNFYTTNSANNLNKDILPLNNFNKSESYLKPTNNNINFLDRTLQILVQTNENKIKLDNVISALESYDSNIPLSNALSIFKSLCLLQTFPPNASRVLCNVQNALIENVGQLSWYEINSIGSRIQNKVNICRQEEFYNKILLDQLAERFVKEDMGLTKGLTLYQCLNSVRHIHKELITYLCEKMYTDCFLNESITEKEIDYIIALVTGLALGRFKPIVWEEIKRPLFSDKILEENYKTLCILSLHLACINYFDEKILSKVFSDDNSYSHNLGLNWTACKLWQKLKTLPDYNGPMPTIKQLKDFKYLHLITKNKKFPLLETLQQFLGGIEYIGTNVLTKYHHEIDHVVCYRKGGFPIAINNLINNKSKRKNRGFISLEDIQIPEDSQIIFILNIPTYWMTRNTNELLGPFHIYIETLESMSYPVIYINSITWENLSSKEKMLLLMKEIKSKLTFMEL